MSLIDPALMQVIQFLAYGIGGLLAALALYFSARAKQISQGNSEKLVNVEIKADMAAIKAEEAKTTAVISKKAIDDNTVLTEKISTIVNGQRETMMSEIKRLSELVTHLGGKP
jgi:hypothetical protein